MGSMDVSSVSPISARTTPAGRFQGGDEGTIFSTPDQYQPTLGVDTGTYKPIPGLTQGEAQQRAQDREADMRLLHSCGEGCSCGVSAAGGDDAVKSLEDRDREVREHEQQHFQTAGDAACGGPEFTMVTASNGRQYAVGGKVHVDVSEVAGDPKATVEKMQRIRRAALAPVSPSAQDRRVAAEATSKEVAAEAKLRDQASRP